jgi:hypothetical protein
VSDVAVGHVSDGPDPSGFEMWLEAVPAELLEDLVHGGDVSVSVSESLCVGQDVVRDRGGWEWCRELVGLTARETNVFVHQVDVEPGLIGSVEDEWDASLEHR